ncbi:MAG TPA: Wzz/FepE/Etk N-terminal domain-containing protein, partial [bacterium]|nr:Wzz/FepE/Etk N-terminal domain-containing protein [bacterium]
MSSSELSPAQEWDLHDYFNLLNRRKVLIGIVFAVCVLSVLFYQFSQPPIYGSSAVFSVDLNEDGGLNGPGFSPYYFYYLNESRTGVYYQTIIYSDVFNQQMMQAIERDSSLIALGENMRAEAKLAAGRGLSLSMNEETRLLTLSVRAGSPVVAYRVADLAAQVFRRRNQEIEMESAQNTVRFINQQRQEAQDRLEEAERALLEFKGGSELSPRVGGSGVVNRVTLAESALEQIELERRLSETNVATYHQQLQNADPSGNAPRLDAADTPELAALRDEIGRLETQRDDILLRASGDSLRVQRLERQIAEKKENLRQRIMTSFDQRTLKTDGKNEQLGKVINERLVAEQVNLNSLRSREKYYRDLLQRYREQSPDMLDRDIELARLQRTQIVHQNLLNYLVERHEEAKIRASASLGGLRTVTPAGIPSDPLPNQASRNVLLSVFLGLGLGFGLALMLEYLDQTIHSREELERLSGLQVVGQIPLHGQSGDSRQPDNNNSDNGKHNGKHNGKLTNRKTWQKTLVLLMQRLHLREPGAPDWKAADYPLLIKMRADVPFAESYRDLRTNL